MHIANDELPFLARHFQLPDLAVRLTITPRPAVDKRSGIPRVMQSLKDARMLRLCPDQLAFVRPRTQTAWKANVLVTQITQGLHRRSRSLEALEDEAQD